jgi:hypothetical protein
MEIQKTLMFHTKITNLFINIRIARLGYLISKQTMTLKFQWLCTAKIKLHKELISILVALTKVL